MTNGISLKTTGDLENLFGSLAFCDCEHCGSVYGPAAYLVDLLAFIDPAQGPKPLSRLFARRPDLQDILLTCENTNTAIPYIDLVNEVLEAYIALRFVQKQDPSTTLPARDTAGASPDELRAVPQYVLDEAYEELYAAVHPMRLPFDRPLAVMRAYLSHVGVSRERLMETLRVSADPWDAGRVAESLGLSPRGYWIVAALPPDASNPAVLLPAYFGFENDPAWQQEIAEVPEFELRTGVGFHDLVELIETWFVNRNQVDENLRIALDSPGECDPDEMTITKLDVSSLDRMHRFLRLWRSLPWSMEDLDRALFALGVGDLDETALRKLSQVRQLQADLQVPLAELLPLWAPIDTWGTDAQYLKLFQNRAVAGLGELEAFRLEYLVDANPDIKDPADPFELAHAGEPTETLDGHVAAVLAALRLTAADLDIVRAHATVNADVPVDLALLSRLYRYAALARGLRIPVADLVSLLHLTGLDPFQPQEPAGTLAFLEAAHRVQASGVQIEVLDYLYRHVLRATRGPAPVSEQVTATLVAIGNALRKLRDDLVDEDDPIGEVTRSNLGRAFDEAVVAQAMAIVLGDAASMPPDPTAFLAEHFAPFADAAEAAQALFHPLPLTDQQRQHNIIWVRDRLLPWLRITLARGVVVTMLADALGLSQPLVRNLLDVQLIARVGATGHAMEDFLALADIEPAEGHRQGYELLHKAALLVKEMGLTDREVIHLHNARERFAGFTLDGLPLDLVDDAKAAVFFQQWSRLADLVRLRADLPAGEHTLIDLFEHTPKGPDPVAGMVEQLAVVTGWNAAHLAALTAQFAMTEDEFRTEVRLLALRDALEVVRHVGAEVEVLFDWATSTPDAEQAKAVVRAVKARYDEESWLDVARGLNDGLREAQRTALVDYLLARMGEQGIETDSQLFEFFLIDVGMQPCMVTSRIKQAISSVQLFVQRCLLDLEDGVDPEVIDGDQWKWRSSYRVWEANRKVFLYPENWIEPELRQDKSPFFRQLETDLLQSELTDENVERAFLNYLRRLDEVARLDVRAMVWQDDPGTTAADRDIDILHIFARTFSPPYRYFYRRLENHREWTPWESIDLDIGDAPHLIPIVQNRRLNLIWTSFTRKPEDNPTVSKDQNPPPPPRFHWEIGLNWSEYRQGGWSPKQMSPHTPWWPYPDDNNALPEPAEFMLYVEEKDGAMWIWLAHILPAAGDAYTALIRRGAWFVRDDAGLAFDGAHWGVGSADALSPTIQASDVLSMAIPQDGSPLGQVVRVNLPSPLRLKSTGLGTKLILGTLTSRTTLNHSNLASDLLAHRYNPFFAADWSRTYFAFPVDATADPKDMLILSSPSPALVVQTSVIVAEKIQVGPPMPDGGPVMGMNGGG